MEIMRKNTELTGVEVIELWLSGENETLSNYFFISEATQTEMMLQGFETLMKKRKHTIDIQVLLNKLNELKQNVKIKIEKCLKVNDFNTITRLSNDFDLLEKVANKYISKMTGRIF